VSAPNSGRTALRVLTVVAVAAVLVAVAVRVAWIGDDAYITLRSVENLCRGDGARWNLADRVQVYTHPLWMLVLSLGRALSGEVYYATLAISLSLSTAAVVWLLARAGSVAATIATGLLLVCARAFPDYMTSGLETPLTYVLLLAFVHNHLREAAPAARYGRAVLLASLLATNRMDLALLCLAPVLATMPGVPLPQLLRRGALGSLPFVLWVAFAWLYYGSPFPVTAHAKAFGVGIPASEVWEQGGRYLLHTLTHDPVLFFVAVLGPVALLAMPRARWLTLGAICYVGYVVKVGGGFMQGRFLLPPFVVAVACAAPWLQRLRGRAAYVFGAVVVGVMFSAGVPAWLGAPSSDRPIAPQQVDAQHGIADERLMYYDHLGLLAPARQEVRFGALQQQHFPGGRDAPWFLLNGAVGLPGFMAGHDGHIVDSLLCDPLIARLPARDPSVWRIGHVLRRIPEGYWESLATGENRIHHPGLRRYYEALMSVTQAPVFDGRRLRMLLDMTFGSFDDDLRAFIDTDYYAPPRLELDASELPDEAALGAFWFDVPDARVIYDGGLAVRFGGPMRVKELAVRVVGLRSFRFRFVQAGEVYGEATGVPAPAPDGLSVLQMLAGFREERVAVPDSVPQFDTVWIDAVDVANSNLDAGPPVLGAIRAGR